MLFYRPHKHNGTDSFATSCGTEIWSGSWTNHGRVRFGIWDLLCLQFLSAKVKIFFCLSLLLSLLEYLSDQKSSRCCAYPISYVYDHEFMMVCCFICQKYQSYIKTMYKSFKKLIYTEIRTLQKLIICSEKQNNLWCQQCTKLLNKPHDQQCLELLSTKII